MNAALPIAGPDSAPWAGRRVFATEEHGEVSIPPELVFTKGGLDIYSEVAEKGLVAVSAKRDRLVLRATSWIGLIPINDAVALEVRPRVPIANLEEMLLTVVDVDRHVLDHHHLEYASGSTATPSLLDLLAMRLASLVQRIRIEGLDFEYKRIEHKGQLVGAIKPWETAMLQRTRANPQLAVSTSWSRSVDTAANRLLKMAISSLLATFRGMQARQGQRKILAELAQAERMLAKVTLDHAFSFRMSTAPTIRRGARLRPSYAEALRLADVVLSQGGVVLRSRGGGVTLNPVLLNMEDAFEKYLRAALAREASREGVLSVRDGNLDPPVGGRSPLYRDPTSAAATKVKASPDIVLSNETGVLAIADVKYKPPKDLPDRDDLNQVLAYALVYGVERVLLAYPRRRTAESHVERVGSVGDVDVSVARFDLNAADLGQEVTALWNALRQSVA